MNGNSSLWSIGRLSLVLAVVLGVVPLSVQADALFARPGTMYIAADETWGTDRSINTDVVVQSGATLTIEDIRVTAAASDPAPYPKGLSDRIEIIVESGGELIVEPGTVLTATQLSGWYGVVFLPGSDGSVTGATIAYGTVGVTIYGASPTISGNTIDYMIGRDGAVAGVGGAAAGGRWRQALSFLAPVPLR
jgi:hypothetical protein